MTGSGHRLDALTHQAIRSCKSGSIWLLLLAGISAGGVHAIASSGYDVWGVGSCLSIASLAALALLVAVCGTVWRAAVVGWGFALTWLCGSVWWLYISMHDYGGLPAPLAALAVFLLCAGMALIYGFAMGLARKASPVKTVCAVSFAAAWLLAELCRGWLFTGFPWGAVGYAHTDGWLSAYASWLGVYGVSAVAALVAGGVAVVLQYLLASFVVKSMVKVVKGWQVVMAVVLVVVTLGVSWPLRYEMTKPAGEMQVALLQGNVPQDLKFDREIATRSLYWYLLQMQDAQRQGAELIVMPETALLYPPEYWPQDIWEIIHSSIGPDKAAALIGMPLYDEHGAVSNSIIGMTDASLPNFYRYDKYHLVPFGEFMPQGFRWFVEMMNIPLGDMLRGDVEAESFLWRGQHIAPNICYEDLFGEELARRFNGQDQNPTIMVNASNIAWFGDTVAIPQHLQVARMRALEFERPMIRATNTGATAIINHKGEVTALLPYYTQGMLSGGVQGRDGLTVYAWWASRWGLLPLWGIGFLVMGVTLILRRKSARL